MVIRLKKKEEGFTLIELMVVMSIIASTSSIILAGVAKSRNQALDAKIKNQLSSLRTAVESFRASNSSNSYGAAVAGWESATGANGQTIGTGCASGLFADPQVEPLVLAKNYPPYSAGVGKCTVPNDGQNYTVTTHLSDNTWWCVDSKGSAKILTGLPTYGGDSCIAASQGSGSGSGSGS